MDNTDEYVEFIGSTRFLQSKLIQPNILSTRKLTNAAILLCAKRGIEPDIRGPDDRSYKAFPRHILEELLPKICPYKNWPFNKELPSSFEVVDGWVMDGEWEPFFPGGQLYEDYYNELLTTKFQDHIKQKMYDDYKRFYLLDKMWYNLVTHLIEDEEQYED